MFGDDDKNQQSQDNSQASPPTGGSAYGQHGFSGSDLGSANDSAAMPPLPVPDSPATPPASDGAPLLSNDAGSYIAEPVNTPSDDPPAPAADPVQPSSEPPLADTPTLPPPVVDEPKELTAHATEDEKPDDSPLTDENSSEELPDDIPAEEPEDANGLLDLKQQALQQLSPLVGHLEQTPEEKFRTTMMMIQAADDQSLVKAAYEAAQQITDEKAKAQALLDVVNEINYFTQPPAKDKTDETT